MCKSRSIGGIGGENASCIRTPRTFHAWKLLRLKLVKSSSSLLLKFTFRRQERPPSLHTDRPEACTESLHMQ